MEKEIETNDPALSVDGEETIVKEKVPEEQPVDEMLADLEAIDKKKHPNKQKPAPQIDEPLDTRTANLKDLVDRNEVLAKVEPALMRVRRHNVTMSVREVIALVNGIITDIKELKGE